MLTQRQQQILDTIRQYRSQHGYSPTVRELGAALGINSPNGVMCHLKSLEKKGVIRRDHNAARSIVLTEDNGDGEGVRLLEQVYALGPALMPSDLLEAISKYLEKQDAETRTPAPHMDLPGVRR